MANLTFLGGMGINSQILEELIPILHRYVRERKPGKRLGYFFIKVGYVKEVLVGKDFHS